MISFILALHNYNLYLVLLSALVAGVWGLVLYFKKRTPTKAWRISLLLAFIFGILQGVFGLLMVLMGLKPGGGIHLYYLHYVYGGIVALALPLVWMSFTTNGQDKRRDMLYFSLGALLIVIVGIRAWMTGPA